MKAIVVPKTGNKDVLEYVDVPQPSPGKGQVLVKVAAIGVNYADIMVRSGTLDVPAPMMPVIPGEEYSGTIEALGDDVRGLEPGQPVVVQAYEEGTYHVAGAYAQYAVANAASVVPLPADIDLDVAAASIANFMTGYLLLHEAVRVKPGQTVLLHGAAGGVGTATIQLAKLANVKVIGLTSSDERARFATEQGADYIINYQKENVKQRVNEITKNLGVNFILNSSGGDTIERDFDLLAPLGQIVWYGMAAGLPGANITNQMATDFLAAKGIKNFVIHTFRAHEPTAWKTVTENILQYLRDKKVKPRIFEKIDLQDAAYAHELLENSSVLGKLILKP